MMRNNNTIEDELDAIRLEFFEKTKHMTIEQKMAFIHEETDPIHKKYGIKPISKIDDLVLNKSSK
jgi:hypothetical protein